MKHPNPDEPFVIQADTTDVAVGVILLQRNKKGKLQPCASMSRKFSNAERYWAIWEKDAYAVRWALLTWKQFLKGRKIPFEMWIGHKNLEVLRIPRELSPKQVQ